MYGDCGKYVHIHWNSCFRETNEHKGHARESKQYEIISNRAKRGSFACDVVLL